MLTTPQHQSFDTETECLINSFCKAYVALSCASPGEKWETWRQVILAGPYNDDEGRLLCSSYIVLMMSLDFASLGSSFIPCLSLEIFD